MKRHSILLGVLLLLAAGARSMPQRVEKSPTQGSWAGQPLGSWRITTTILRNPGRPHSVLIQRVMLVGASSGGEEWCQVEQSDSPEGPWEYRGGVGSGTQEEQRKVTSLPDEEVRIGDRVIQCRVSRTEQTNDYGTTIIDRWVDAQTGLELKYIQRHQSATKSGGVSQVEFIPITAQTQTIKGRTIQTFTVSYTQSSNGKIRSVGESIISADVAGRIVASRGWTGTDKSVQPGREVILHDWGQSDEMFAAQKARDEAPKLKAAAEREAMAKSVRRNWERAIAGSRSEKASTRANSAQVLGGWENSPEDLRHDVIDAVSTLIDDPEANVRQTAAIAAAKLKVPNAAFRIVEQAKHDPDGQVYYVIALGTLADPVGLPTILSAAGSTNDNLRSKASEMLMHFNDTASAAVLVKLLGDPDGSVRSAAIGALTHRNERSAMPAILRHLNDSYPLARGAAIGASAAMDDGNMVALILPLVTDSHENVRMAAFTALPKLKGDRRAMGDTLLACLDQQSNRTYQIALITTVQIGERRVVPRLIRMADAPVGEKPAGMLGIPDVVVAIALLGKFQDPPALEALLRLTQDPVKGQAACKALGEMGGDAVADEAWKRYRSMVDVPRQTDHRVVGRGTFLQLVGKTGGVKHRDQAKAYLDGDAQPSEKAALRSAIMQIETRLGSPAPLAD